MIDRPVHNRTRGKWKHFMCNELPVQHRCCSPLFPSLSTWTPTIHLWRRMAMHHRHRIQTTEATVTMIAITMVKLMVLDKFKVSSKCWFIGFFFFQWMTTDKLKALTIHSCSRRDSWWLGLYAQGGCRCKWCSGDDTRLDHVSISLILSLLLWRLWMTAQLAKRRIIKHFDVCSGISMLH